MSTILVWDASALAKRYIRETGNDTVNELFNQVPLRFMRTTIWGYVETLAILNRKKNVNKITQAVYHSALYSVRQEVFRNPDFDILSMDDDDILGGVPLTQTHNINTVDAAILAIVLRERSVSPLDTLVLPASDTRLIRAAIAENLAAINPETLAVPDVTPFLAAL